MFLSSDQSKGVIPGHHTLLNKEEHLKGRVQQEHSLLLENLELVKTFENLKASQSLFVIVEAVLIEDGNLKKRNGLLDFTDLISRAANLLNRSNIADWVQFKLDQGISHVLVDEAQFLEEAQVWQLCRVADRLGIPVMCFGLRTDFQGKLFPGSKALLALADTLREIKTICWCGRKATMVVRLDGEGRVLEDGDQVAIGGEDRYVSLCRRHWDERNIGPAGQLKMFL